MFNFRKKDNRSEAEIVAEIHEEFNTASDKALASAKAILAQDTKTDEVDMLRSLGFKNSKVVKEHQDYSDKYVFPAKEMSQTITKYNQDYPLYKFITTKDAEAICGKYKLLCVPVENYTGDIPTKNVEDMMKFKRTYETRSVGHRVEKVIWYSYGKKEAKKIIAEWLEKNRNFVKKEVAVYSHHVQSYLEGIIRAEVLRKTGKHMGSNDIGMSSVTVVEQFLPDELYVCASKKEINMKGLVGKGTFMEKASNLVKAKFETAPPDPVVLARVPHGYLIVTAWGPEASDPLVVDTRKN